MDTNGLGYDRLQSRKPPKTKNQLADQEAGPMKNLKKIGKNENHQKLVICVRKCILLRPDSESSYSSAYFGPVKS